MTIKNPLRAWFAQEPKPMLQREFMAKVGISQSFLTSLLSDRPPWPSRETMRRIVKLTNGAVTADQWMAMPDPMSREEADAAAARRKQITAEVKARMAQEEAPKGARLPRPRRQVA